MKKVLALICCMVLLYAAVSLAALGLTGTPHDLSATNGEICVACHTPHAAITGDGPLWNRTQATTPSYTYYTSATFDRTSPALSLGPQSLACMTCHNGVASSIVNGPGSGTGDQATYALAAASGNSIKNNAFSNLGTDLRDDHPVGFTYVAGNDNQGENFPVVNGQNKIDGTAGDYPIFGGTKFECATCHDVHNTSYDNASSPYSQVYFLRASNQGSAMCGDCHTSKF